MVRFKRIIKYENGELWIVFSTLGMEFLVQQENKLIYAVQSPVDYSKTEEIAEILEELKEKYELVNFESDILNVAVMKNCETYNFRIMGDEDMVHMMCSYGGSHLQRSLFAYGSYYNLPGVLNMCVGLTP